MSTRALSNGSGTRTPLVGGEDGGGPVLSNRTSYLGGSAQSASTRLLLKSTSSDSLLLKTQSPSFKNQPAHSPPVDVTEDEIGFGLTQTYDLLAKLEMRNVHILDGVVVGSRSDPVGLYTSGLDYRPQALKHAEPLERATVISHHPNWPSEDVEENQVKRLFLVKRETTEATRGRLLLRHMTQGLGTAGDTPPVQSPTSGGEKWKGDTGVAVETQSFSSVVPAALHLKEVPAPRHPTEDGTEFQAAEIGVKVTAYDVSSLEGAVSRKELDGGILVKYPRHPPSHHNLVRVIFTPYLTKVEFHQNDANINDPAVPLKQRLATSIRSKGVSIYKPSAEILASADALCDAIFETFRKNGVLVRMAVYYCMYLGNGCIALLWVGKMEVKSLNDAGDEAPPTADGQRLSSASLPSRIANSSTVEPIAGRESELHKHHVETEKVAAPIPELPTPTPAPPTSPIHGPAAVDQKINELHEVRHFGFYTQSTTNYEVNPVGIRPQIKGYFVVQDHKVDLQAAKHPKVDSTLMTVGDREILDVCRKYNRWVEAVLKDPTLAGKPPFRHVEEEPKPTSVASSTPRSEVFEDPNFPELERNAAAWQIHSKETVAIRHKYGSYSLEKEERSYIKTIRARRAYLLTATSSRPGTGNSSRPQSRHQVNRSVSSLSGGNKSSSIHSQPWRSVSHLDYNSRTPFQPNTSKHGTVAICAVDALIAEQGWKAGVPRKNIPKVKDGSLMNYLAGCERLDQQSPQPIRLLDPRDVTGRGLARRHQLFTGIIPTSFSDSVALGAGHDEYSIYDGLGSVSAQGVRINAALPPAPPVEYANTHQSISEEMLRANKKKGRKYKGSGTVLEQLFGPLHAPPDIGSQDREHALLRDASKASILTQDPTRTRLRPISLRAGSSSSLIPSPIFTPESSIRMPNTNYSGDGSPRSTARGGSVSNTMLFTPTRATQQRLRSTSLLERNHPEAPSKYADSSLHASRFASSEIIRYAIHLADTVDDLLYRAQCSEGESHNPSGNASRKPNRAAKIHITIPSTVVEPEERRDLASLMLAVGFLREEASDYTSASEQPDEGSTESGHVVLSFISNSVFTTRVRESLKLFLADVEALFDSGSPHSAATSSSSSNSRLETVKKLVAQQGYSFVDAMISCHTPLADRIP